MHVVGDGPEGQPTEGVVTLDDIADAMEPSEAAPEESEEEEDSGESEEVEAEEEEAAETEEEEGEEPTFTIKHDGKEVTLKQSELVEMAQKGFDYSTKTMALAKERDEAQAHRARADELRTQNEQYSEQQIDRLTAIAHFAQAQVGEPPNIALAQQDAARYLAEKHLYDQRQGQLQQALQAVEHLKSESQRQRQAWIDSTANETEEALRNTLPGWNETMLEEYAKYLGGYGLNPRTADVAFVQKGLWELAHKAKQFDAIQAKKAEIKPTPKAVTKVAKPSAQNQPGKVAERMKREAAFNKNPSLDSLAEFLR
ncbi:hypothetical protein [Noviluteimonas gilva]|uniref:Scaffolding protein n=1 Tax=Noviluteimonas gilva TaxID=2682097 RepID=A0A7C9LWG6_9GAMM|nr:hypothetical protein [Lysobacter gilvus]MUV13585.1 hypothetical protein [Lysobacter gilvus]